MISEAMLKPREIKELQHEFKNHIQAYTKRNMGKASEHVCIMIVKDLLLIRCEGFLTESEKFICQSSNGFDAVRAARIESGKRIMQDNMAYFEEMLAARFKHQTICIEPENDFCLYVIIFDRMLCEK